MKAYTGRGDDGTTGLLYGGRLAKDHPRTAAVGAVDEAQAALGVVRAEAPAGSELGRLLVHLQHDLYVLMAELATAPENRHRLQAGTTLVTSGMVGAVERVADDLVNRFEPPREFVLPGEDRVSALLEVARTVVRRSERAAVAVAVDGSSVVPYLNRLSSLMWAMARWQESDRTLSKSTESLETESLETESLEEA